MKKRLCAVLAALMLGSWLAGCGRAGGGGEPISLPEKKEVVSVVCTAGEEKTSRTERSWVEGFLDAVAAAESTGSTLEQDTPPGDSVKVELVFANGNTSVFYLYRQDGNWYAARPQEEVYLLEDSIIEPYLQKQ